MRYVEVRAIDESPLFSIADALQALKSGAGLSSTDAAIIRIGKLRLPTGNDVLLVRVETSILADLTTFAWLKTATAVRGRREGRSDLEVIDPEILDGAIVDFDGYVSANNNWRYRSVQVDPFAMHVELTEQQIRILMALLRAVPDSAKYLRSVRDGVVPREEESMIPEYMALDFAKLRELQLPLLKQIGFLVRHTDPSLSVTDQTIANALQSFGLRLPRRRPRSY